MNQTDFWTLGVIVCLALVTLLTRCFFFISSKPWSMPRWVQRGLQYAPVAALSAVIIPEIIMTQGELLSSWKDARLFAAIVGIGWYFWRRRSNQAVLETLVAGILVFLPLHLLFGW